MEDPDQRRMLELLMPERVEIVNPFTRVRSFDDDDRPDGIELLLRAVNALDNPGLMITGRVRVELYEHMQATADSRGRRLDQWDIELTTREQQRRHWNQVTQMYEFRLGVDPASVAAARRYVLTVTYTTPFGRHLTDETMIEYRPLTRPMGGGPSIRPDISGPSAVPRGTQE